ncbi:MAG TPA: hypothetical protein VNM24_04750, partial [Burkholderiales bacterium]|nr:hypothetical protein [Burkholderiales bacterium]
MARIDLIGRRERLPVRPAPYWRTIRRGHALGFRRTRFGGTWVARIFVNGKLSHKALGEERELTYEEALALAEQWWKTFADGVPRDYDVLDALEDYAHTKAADGSQTVWQDLDSINKHVTGEFLALKLGELKTADLER